MLATHTDAVGSLLRPPELLNAQEQLAAGLINQGQFERIEDQAVDDAIALQEGVGLGIVTDGEMRRQSFQSQMTAAVSGFGEQDLGAFLWGEWYDEKGVKKTRRGGSRTPIERSPRSLVPACTRPAAAGRPSLAQSVLPPTARRLLRFPRCCQTAQRNCRCRRAPRPVRDGNAR